VARVQGDVFAGGMGLVAACDVAVSVDSAQFCLSEVKLGLGNYERMEVLEGIKEGELVARPLNGIEMVEGMKVEAKEITWP
jgi:hypothetical protein